MSIKKDQLPLSLYYAGDAYSTSRKIMGRQSAGKALIKGIARTFPQGAIYGIGPDETGGTTLAHQLMHDGFTGRVHWSLLPNIETAKETGTLYYPAPISKDLAYLRNTHGSNAFSFIGVTHTLSSAGAIDQISDLIFPPFKPWDALICTSLCAQKFVQSLHQDLKLWWQDEVGKIPFNNLQLPIIPLGVDTPYFAPNPKNKAFARSQLDLCPEDVVFIFSGRLSFHAKANPVPMYQALEKAAQHQRIVCIEAGVFGNAAIKNAYLTAQQEIAPSVRFIWVNGQDETQYRLAWQAADVFVSLSDNIQETFGLTPLEAKAAGIPVIVADWNGYQETVRDGIDGFKIPTVLPPPGIGNDLAVRHGLGMDNYDLYIGRVSLSTVVEPDALSRAVSQLALDSSLRTKMGASGRQHALEVYDWPVILHQYSALAHELKTIRPQGQLPRKPWPQREDPFTRFAHFSTTTLHGGWAIQSQKNALDRLHQLLALNMTNYAFKDQVLESESLVAIITTLQMGNTHTVNSVLKASGQNSAAGVRALMWLWKFDLIHVNQND